MAIASGHGSNELSAAGGNQFLQLLNDTCENHSLRNARLHHDRPYGGGRHKHWINVNSRGHPAYERVKEAFS